METSVVEVRAVEVRYAGVIVGRGALVRELGTEGAFVGIAEPMPVGTAVTLTIGETVRPAIVDEVVESADASAVGMRVRWGGAPAPRPEPAKPKVPVAAPPTAAAPVPVTAAPAGLAPAPAAPAPSPPAPVAVAPVAAAPETPTVTDAPADAPIAAPLSLAGPSDPSHQGGGKKRRKRR